MTKSVICIICAFTFMLINVIVLFFKEDFSLLKNTPEEFYIYYSRKISNLLFVFTVVIFLLTIYFAVNFKHLFCYILLFIDFIMTIIYTIINYKIVYVSGDNIEVNNLFVKNYSLKFSGISKAIYYPNAKIRINLKRRKIFSVSFNSINFRKFYEKLLSSDVKLTIASIPYNLNHISLPIYDMNIVFPNTMFKENYQGKYFLRNSQYVFSARDIENKEFIEGYIKESSKPTDEFLDIIKTDLYINDFKVEDEYKININTFDFQVIKSTSKNNHDIKRIAYIYNSGKSFFILYMDFPKDNEEQFINKMNKAIQKI